MKITRANVEVFAISRGWESVQIDGIPEGFSWKEPDVTISTTAEPKGVLHKGRIIKFKPLGEWDKDITYEQGN